MSDLIWVAIITATPSIITAIGTFSLHRKVDAVKKEVVTVKQEINGRMGQLLKVTDSAALARGILEEKQRQTADEEGSG